MEAVAGRPWQTALVGDVTGEIRRIDFGLEADQIVVAKGRDELIVVWQSRDDLRRRERNVDEKTDPVVMPAIANALASGIR